jgi:hypothetical protein
MKSIVGNRKNQKKHGMTTLSIPKKVFISALQINILMELNIHGIIMIQFSILTHHHYFSRKINKKSSDIQIDEVHNLSRFSSIRKRFRNNLVVTNNMSIYVSNLVTIDNLSENKKSHQWNCIGRNTVSNR